MLLKDQVGIVTGASRGIGRTMAIGLAAESATIIVNYSRSEDAADEVLAQIRKRGGTAEKFCADVSKKAEVEEMISFTLNRFGKIDFLINNAGIYPRILVEDMSEEVWDLVLDTNLKGTFLCSQAVIKTMKQQSRGRIVNITSGRGIGGDVSGTHYSASKAGIMGFTKSLSLELAPYRINVNAIAPGYMITAQSHWKNTPEEIKKLLDECNAISNPLMQKARKPDDIMGTVLFLLTDASRVITGQTIFLNTP